jgi:hypothetical protein
VQGAVDAVDVDVDHARERCVVDLPDGAVRGDAGIGQDVIDPAEVCPSLIDGLGDGGAAADVRFPPGRVVAELGGEVLEQVGFEAEQRDLAAGRDVAARNARADATRRAGDEGDLAVEVVGHALTIRRGREVGAGWQSRMHGSS